MYLFGASEHSNPVTLTKSIILSTCGGSPWSGQLVRIELNGKVDVILTDSSSWFANPMLAPDGKRIAFEAKTYDTDAWMYEGL